MRAQIHFFVAFAAVSGATSGARALPCLALRPTDVAADWSYAGAQATSIATAQGNVRVWFATEGPHAPLGVSSAEPPEAALLAGAAAESALLRYDALGFRRPVSDGAGSPCADNGGDARLDIYLFDFKSSADGTVVRESCSEITPQTCAGFALVENDFASGSYANATEAYRTVVPHELFHLVQSAYALNDETWWAEGTAQWATKRLFPELTDLESFLPAFFKQPERPLDFPAGGAAASISYGAAIWPTFLSERFDPDVPRDVFEQLTDSVLSATEAALADREASLADAFAEFARWNSATGARATSGNGYADAASYPQVVLEPLSEDVPSSLSGKLAGLSARYFSLAADGARRSVALKGNLQRVGAWFLPLAEGRPDLSAAEPLPFVFEGPGIVVVTGRATDHRDVAFSLDIDEAVAVGPSEGGANGGGAGGAPASEVPSRGGAPAIDPELGETAAGVGGTSDQAPPEPVDEEPLDEPELVPVEKARVQDAGGCAVSAPDSRAPSPRSAFFAAIPLIFSFARRASRRRLPSRSPA
jgi:hypothetical protein